MKLQYYIIIIICLLIIKHYYTKYNYYKYLSSQNYNDVKNISCSNIYVKNINNNKLHIQNYNKNHEIIVLSLHGYGSHCSRKPHEYLRKKLNENNIEYITFDFTGHGNSDGIKGYIENIDILINDVLTILVYIYTNNQIPIKSLYIQGHSMGGGVAIIIGDILSYARSNSIIFNQNKDLFINRIIPTFRGLILLAPLIEFNNYKLLDIFTKFLIILPANISIPTFIFDENKYYDKIWKHKKYREYIELDSNLYNKNKLGYSNNIKFGTLITLYNLTKLVKKIIKDIRYPFIVLYDNNKDIIISKNSIDFLMEHSKSIDKKYINIIDGLHDLLANEKDVVIYNILEWIKNKK